MKLRTLVGAYLVVTLITAGLIRSAGSDLRFFADALVAGAALMMVGIPLIGASVEHGTNRLHGRLLVMWVRTLLVTTLLYCYGFAVQSWNSGDMVTGLKIAFRLLPFALFPLYVYAFASLRSWRRLLVLMVVVSVAVAILDLVTGAFPSTHGGIERLMSLRFHNELYYYGTCAALLMLVIGRFSPRQRAMLLAAIPVLLLRTAMAISRGETIGLLFVCIYAMVIVFLRQGKREQRKSLRTVVVLGAVLAVGMIIGASKTNDLGRYVVILQQRAHVVDRSIEYRKVESLEALQYGGLAGAGWGTREVFEAPLRYTNSSKTFGKKSYVHNLFAFAVFKLGLLGGLVVLSLAVLVWRAWWAAWRIRCWEALVIVGLFLPWFANAMVNLVFMQPGVNAWMSFWIAVMVSTAWQGKRRAQPVYWNRPDVAPRRCEQTSRRWDLNWE